MSKISLIAKLFTDPDKSEEVEAALAVSCAASAEESGLEIYSAHKDSNEEGVYWFFELYTDEEALGEHGSGEAMAAAMSSLGALLTAAPVINMAMPKAAKGMAL